MKAATREDLSYQYFCFYVTDYLHDQDMELMSMAAEACWLRLLAKQWKAGKLPASPEQLRRLTKATETEWSEAWPSIEPLFPIDDDGARRNASLKAQRTEREAFIERRREIGKLGGRGNKRENRERTKHNVELNESSTEAPAFDNTKHDDKLEESSEKARGLPNTKLDAKQNVKHTERLELESRAIPLSPTPSGVGASPTTQQKHVLSFASAEQRSEAFHVQLNAAVLELPVGAARDVVKRFLDEQRVPSQKWQEWVSKIAGWQQGLGTSGMRPVSWDAIASGLSDLLLTNPVGQQITPKVALIFVEDAEKARQFGGTAPARAGARPPRVSTERSDAIAFARDGDATAIEYCATHGIDYTAEVA
jgi:uncharacterized protein YdaU (DUF1376 family)